MRQRRGFSLLELMVVLAIVSILFAMGFSLMGDQRRSSAVEAEAQRLAAVLRHTRHRAINEQVAYGVAFNIRNALDTSGAVLNNWDGGHYYRVLGPNRGQREQVRYNHRHFPAFVNHVRSLWVSEPHVLPARSVRFLALSDLDRGPRSHKDDIYYSDDATYPRPWFGVYDQAAKRWWPWGGYDPSKNYSGFYYEGKDGDVTGSRNPVTRSYNIDLNKNGVLEDNPADPSQDEVGYVIWEEGEGRELVNANWLDACLFFMPSGEVNFMEWNLGRRAYAAGEGHIEKMYFGINDRCMIVQDGTNTNGKDGRIGHAFNVSLATKARWHLHPESQHFVAHNGGWHITLAPDAQHDANNFETVDDAIASFTPAWRVFVSATGAIHAFRVQSRRSGSFLEASGKPVWPSDPSDWQDNAFVKKFHGVGWQHEEGTGWWLKRAVPTGEPINDMITGRMLTDRIWWYGEE